MGAVGSRILVKNSKADMTPYRQDALLSRKGKHTLRGGGLGIDKQHPNKGCSAQSKRIAVPVCSLLRNDKLIALRQNAKANIYLFHI